MSSPEELTNQSVQSENLSQEEAIYLSDNKKYIATISPEDGAVSLEYSDDKTIARLEVPPHDALRLAQFIIAHKDELTEAAVNPAMADRFSPETYANTGASPFEVITRRDPDELTIPKNENYFRNNSEES